VQTVGELIVSDGQVGPAALVREVAERFFSDPALEALAVVEGDRPIGLVTRSRLLLKLARGFGQELYAKKPIGRIADAAPLVVGEDLDVAVAVSRALERQDAAVYDEVVVIDAEGAYLGLLSVRQLLLHQGLALARAQAEAETAQSRSADLEKLERLRAQFLAHTTHELRSPANAVVGVAELIRRHAEKGAWAQVAAKVPVLQRAAMTLRSTVNNILDLSKLEAGRTEVELGPVEVPTLLDDVAATARLLCGERPVAVVVEADGAPLEVISDGQMLRQILTNLASNAAKFTEQGQVTIGAAAAPDGLRLWVADTGLGIRDEDLARLFQPFGQLEDAQQKRHEGTGLGLVIARSMVNLLAGRIEVASRFGEGTTFTVHLPTCAALAAPERATA
jgi:signal transduction histidine kinase